MDFVSVSVDVTDLSSVKGEAQDRLSQRLCEEESRRPFDLTEGPLLRTRLLWKGEGDYVLLLTLHHIASDGWSQQILVRELMELYGSFSSGVPSPLEELGIQYGDYAEWQRAWLQGEAYREQMGYWKEQLAGMETLQLPTDHARPAMQSFRGGVEQCVVEAEVLSGLRELARREGVTLYMVLLASFVALLHRYSGQGDVVLGTPIANRNRPEIEGLIGFFVNMLVLRVQVRERMSFRELVREVREVSLGAYAHQDLPFDSLVDELQPERDMSRHPLFQVGFSLQAYDELIQHWGSAEIRPLSVDHGTAKYDWTLQITEQEKSLQLYFEYSTELYEQETIQRVVRHYRRLIEAAIANPTCDVGALEMLDIAEQEQLREAWNRTEVSYPDEHCVHELIAKQAVKRPDAIAIVCGDEAMSYSELDRRANQLAHHLRVRGVGPERIVGVLVPRRPETILAILAVLKAGGAYLPLDPGVPQQRLQLILEEAGTAILLSPDREHYDFPAAGVDVISIAEQWDEIAKNCDGPPTADVDWDHLCYVIYTSGSSGKPKGVLLHHRGLMNFVQSQIDVLGVDQDWRALQFASMSFDASITEVFPVLVAGGTLCLAAREQLLGGREMEHLLMQYQIVFAVLPPSVLSLLTAEKLSALHTVVSAGETCGAEIAEKWSQGRRLFNGYGPTEATVGPLLHAVQQADAEKASVPVGRPIANTQVYVLNQQHEVAGVGIAGEIVIGGHGVSRGYLHLPELTAEKFIPDPFSKKPGARLYRTGDLGRSLSDGTMQYLGRIDQQVKIRGHRIELGEIESILRQYPAVHTACVVVDERMHKRLVACVVLREASQHVTQIREDLDKHLRLRLPEYMLPSEMFLLNELPQTTTGKVDRQKLMALYSERAERLRPFVAPQTERQKIVARAWEKALNRERVGLEENFFEVGGHSLLLAQLSQRLSEDLGRVVSILELYRFPTIAAFVHHLDHAGQIQDRSVEHRGESRQFKRQTTQSIAQRRIQKRRAD